MPRTRPPRLPWIALTLALVARAQAGVVVPDATPEQPAPSPLTLVSQEVEVHIVDQVATSTVVHVFRNDRPAPTGGTFVLPISEHASVQEYAFWTGGRRIASRVQTRQAAQAEFEAAEAQGARAGLLAWKPGTSFETRFTPLAPGETRRFEVVYSELLPYESGRVRYTHPLDYGQLGMPAPEALRLHVRIDDSKPIVAARTPGLPGEVRGGTDGRDITMTLRGVAPSQDFELEYELQSQDFGLALRTFRDGEGDGYFVAMIAPREAATDAQIVRKDVAFVFDTSGSMAGAKIDQARSALKACLNLMNPGDGVYLLAFSDVMNPYRNEVVPLDERVRRDASAFADGLQSGGGTHIQDAVLDALTLLGRSERPTALVFLTDGLGQRPAEETLRRVQEANVDGRTRIFTFGVGGDVNRPFLERLGTENRGGFESIADGVAIDAAVAGFYAQIARPVLTDLQFDFGGVVANRSSPSRLPDVYQGQRLVVTGRYRGQGPDTFTVRGRIGGVERALSQTVDWTGDASHPWVGRLWARRRADELLAQIRMYGETAEARDEVIALSSAWDFATPYTSLVALADPRVASLTPARVKPGDPVLAVPAPADSVAVTAFFPFGEVKALDHDEATGMWTGRFLVPRSAEDGVYWIHVVATSEGGRSTWWKLAYTVDTTAPVVEAFAPDTARPGDLLRLSARPLMGFLELGDAMVGALGADIAARAKAFVDIRQVVARLGDRTVELRSTPGGEPGFHGLLAVPLDLPCGTYHIEVTATDVAGNKNTVVLPLSVGPGPIVGAL